MSHAKVIQKYAERKINSRTGTVCWNGSRVYCDGNVLYSYGRHFPLAVYLGEVGKGKRKHHLFIKNGDRYSSSTSTHQGITQRCCKGPTVSATALLSAGIDITSLKLENVLHYWEDMRQYCYRDSETGAYYLDYDYTGEQEDSSLGKLYTNPWKPPKQGMFVAYSYQDDLRFQSGAWHVLGSVVLYKNDRYYLASLDESRYFVSELSRKPRSVKDAFESLKPSVVRKAERKGVAVKRQGEWFFLPTSFDDRAMADYDDLTLTQLKSVSKPSPLPVRNPQSNQHVCRNFVARGSLFARGKVRHPEHRTLDLGDEWHEVHRNTELASWSQGGRFD